MILKRLICCFFFFKFWAVLEAELSLVEDVGILISKVVHSLSARIFSSNVSVLPFASMSLVSANLKRFREENWESIGRTRHLILNNVTFHDRTLSRTSSDVRCASFNFQVWCLKELVGVTFFVLKLRHAPSWIWRLLFYRFRS